MNSRCAYLYAGLLASLFIRSIAYAAPTDPDMTLRDAVLSGLTHNTQQHFLFVQEKKLAILEKPLITEGELLLDNSGNKQQTVTWDIQKPYVLRYVLTADSICESDAQGERTVLMSQNPIAAALTQAMTATFSGQWKEDALSKNSETLANITATGTLAAWQLHITPNAEVLKPLITSIDVKGADKTITAVSIAEANGDSTVIHLQPFIAQ